MDNKKTIIASIIGVALLVVLVVGATFAYFTTAVTNDDGETLLTGKTDAIGSISLTNPTSKLHITLNAIDMAQDNLNTYWATNDATLNYDSAEVQRDIAVATLTGGEATTHYECTTTINVSVSGTMVAGLQTGDAYIQFGGLLTNKVDLKNVSSTGYPVTFALNGTDKLTDKVSAAIAIENRNANQNSIAGKELSVRFTNNDLVCKVVDAPEAPAFAIYSADDYSLRFYKNFDEVNVGDTYNNLTVTELYTGIEDAEYTSETNVPWNSNANRMNYPIMMTVLEDRISPKSTAYMFSQCGGGVMKNDFTLDLTNLDTSKVENMEGMFTACGPRNIIGLENLDTSNVTNMSKMFYNYNAWSSNYVLEGTLNWDTSNVTDMSWMFYQIGFNTMDDPSASKLNIDISNWDTSNVTNMEKMFYKAAYANGTFDLGGKLNWDTSNVTNMNEMFYEAGYNASSINLDLTSWDTSKINTLYNMFGFLGYNSNTFNLNLTGWKTDNVTNMAYMLSQAGYSASTWTAGDLSNWNVSNVANMTFTFAGNGTNASSWTVGDLSGWDVSKVTNMSSMFSSTASQAKTFSIGNIASWKTGNVTDMSGMFSGTAPNASYSLDLSGWDVSKVSAAYFFKSGVESKITSPNFNSGVTGM